MSNLRTETRDGFWRQDRAITDKDTHVDSPITLALKADYVEQVKVGLGEAGVSMEDLLAVMADVDIAQLPTDWSDVELAPPGSRNKFQYVLDEDES